MKKAIVGIFLLGVIAPMSLHAAPANCDWLPYSTGGLAAGGAAATSGGGFLYSTSASSSSSGLMFCDWVHVDERERMMYIAHNHSPLLEEAARGSGAHLEALAVLHQCPVEVSPEFGTMLKQRFAEDETTFFEANQSLPQARKFLGLVQEGIEAHPVLARECQSVG